MLSIIKDKKIDSRIVMALLYISFCAAGFMTARGKLALLMSNFANPSVIINNHIVAFFVGGLIPFLLYELLTRFAFRFVQARIVGCDTDAMRYSLRFFYICANILIFLVKLLYIPFPLISVYGDILFDFVFAAAFFVLFLWFVCKQTPKDRWSVVLYQLGGTFIIIYGIIEVITIILGVI